MNWWAEAQRSIVAAARMARFDAGGIAGFNLTLDGFWRSFGAALLVLPFAMMLARDSDPDMLAMSWTGWGVDYVVSWIAFPLAMVWVSRLLGITGRYVTFIIAYNWSSVVQVGVLFLLWLLNFVGLLTGELQALVLLLAYLYLLGYSVFVARVAAGVPWLTATGLVALDLALSLALLRGVAALFPGA